MYKQALDEINAQAPNIFVELEEAPDGLKFITLATYLNKAFQKGYELGSAKPSTEE